MSDAICRFRGIPYISEKDFWVLLAVNNDEILCLEIMHYVTYSNANPNNLNLSKFEEKKHKKLNMWHPLTLSYLSCVTRKPVFRISEKSDTNLEAVQQQKMARPLEA